uniref:HIT domain-containing protein n=1 Tax=Alexandrium andersonii TaxID=327968 RepID=A0A7S2B1M0_9DINO|mmetsp:Transcript_20911/g.47618  ORF Transcript_20911/g.47618 Transcript_20911/m.47618 type:complete len:166 (+) Transcript_20911:61-558(+)
MGIGTSAYRICAGSERKGVRYHEDGSVAKCIFCDIVADECDEAWRQKGTDGHVTWFRSQAGDAEEHWLIVPCRHVQNVNDPELDGELLDHMVAVGRKRGDLLCFHNPPFNSVDHLHLHAFRGPFRNIAKDFKHRPARWKLWTLSPEDVDRGLLRSSDDIGSEHGA